ncbi:MAG: general secretion pathway protein GspC [Polyangiaceae bacterium]|nr:general secretion pathway protein GspC [Myxococcales bacterium]MCC6900845.1 general secretion pathway protein GspC [Polyangiaceae bacterium]
MAFDALLKKYFAVVVLTLVAAMAYFQASGAMKLFGASLGADEKTLTQAPKPLPHARPPETTVATRSAEPILSRNPFDSVTGPLNAAELDVSSLPSPAADLSDPLAVSKCDGIRVSIITESTDPMWSIAALQGPGEARPTIRRVGDKVGSHDVTFIGYNPRENSPSVWLTNAGSVCQLVLFAAQPAPAPPVAAASAGPAAPAGKGAASGVPADIASKIQKVSETEFNVDRSVVDKILENQAELMRSARIVPEQQNGKVVGIRLFGIRPETLLGTLGFQTGDRLETINGFNMASPEKALEAYARLRTASNLNVKINRRGKPMSIDFRIK